MTGIYIHVPFCEKRCSYCNFYSTTHGKKERDAFTRSLIAELQYRRVNDEVPTLYFGGGTPSQLDEEELASIFETIHANYRLCDDAEVTFEINPDDLTPLKASFLAQLGINRVSLGVQSFDDAMLQRINRRHNAQQAVDAIQMLHDANIRNVSIDLIYGLPSQTLEDWECELQTAFSLPIQHISAYALTYEQGTALHRLLQQGKVMECDEEISLSMFRTLIATSSKNGFEHYEISNFAQRGFASRHNYSYWQGVPYLGFGPSAHSYDGVAIRRYNHENLSAYNHCSIGNLPSEWDVPHTCDQLSENERYDELVMTHLRTAKGLPLEKVFIKFGSQRLHYLRRMAQPHLQKGWLEEVDEDGSIKLQLTDAGIFVSDFIITDLMAEED